MEINASNIFIQVYIDAYRSGMVTELESMTRTGGLWSTLQCVATYMNKDGYCYPSHKTIAEQLGVGRKTVQKCMQLLEAFRWNGNPIIECVNRSQCDGQANRYRILPQSYFTDFLERKSNVKA